MTIKIDVLYRTKDYEEFAANIVWKDCGVVKDDVRGLCYIMVFLQYFIEKYTKID